MFTLKPLSIERVEAALSKAAHYRLLNQPRLAESICLDILAIAPDNQEAIIILVLALTDQFGHLASKAPRQALELAGRLQNEYARLYYTGIVHERQGNAALHALTPGAGFDAYEWYVEAMLLYEKAEAIGHNENTDPILRWNTCARIIMEHHLEERPPEEVHPMLE